jgi:acyl-coenzyme A synthetase/AMP-(fatty) acid ligase
VSELAVAIVPQQADENGNIDRAGLRQFFQKQLGERTPKRWIIVKEIPRNEQGKIDRIRLKEIARRRLALAA